jgi:hypothetical protein
MKGLSAGRRHIASLAWVLGTIWLLGACNSQPAKYRHSNDCKCPKWNYVPKPRTGTEHADGHPGRTPYYCGPGSHS